MCFLIICLFVVILCVCFVNINMFGKRPVTFRFGRLDSRSNLYHYHYYYYVLLSSLLSLVSLLLLSSLFALLALSLWYLMLSQGSVILVHPGRSVELAQSLPEITAIHRAACADSTLSQGKLPTSSSFLPYRCQPLHDVVCAPGET